MPVQSFEVGNAEPLGFADASCDAVLNVECPVRRAVGRSAALGGTTLYGAFRSGTLVYRAFVLHNGAAAGAG